MPYIAYLLSMLVFAAKLIDPPPYWAVENRITNSEKKVYLLRKKDQNEQAMNLNMTLVPQKIGSNYQVVLLVFNTVQRQDNSIINELTNEKKTHQTLSLPIVGNLW